MKKVLPLVALLAAWALVLTWCNKTENVEEVVEETGAVEETNLKTSLDLGELIGLIENHFPKSYEYSQFSIADNLIGEEGNYVYVVDINTGVIPFVNTQLSTDISDLIKKEVGIQ